MNIAKNKNVQLSFILTTFAIKNEISINNKIKSNKENLNSKNIDKNVKENIIIQTNISSPT